MRLPELQREPSQERSEGALGSTAGSSGGASITLLWLWLAAAFGLPTMRCLPTSPASPEADSAYERPDSPFTAELHGIQMSAHL